MTREKKSYLAGDVGGTKTLLVRREKTGSGWIEVERRAYRTAEHAGLSVVLDDFLATDYDPIDCAVLAVAGPVRDQKSVLTNVAWQMDADAIAERFDIETVVLMNDVQALAEAVPCLESEDVHTFSFGQPDPCGTVGVAAAGTGLGEAFLTWSKQGYTSQPSEGGHADFAPATEEQVRLLRFLLRDQEHVSVEQLCSGLGLPTLYRFLRTEWKGAGSESVRASVERAEDPTPVIVESALSRSCPLCVRTLKLFVELLGAELGNLALKVLATGGVYLGGGIPPRIVPFLEGGALLTPFQRKGRFSRFLAEMPVHMILAPDGVVRGAARRAASVCEDSHSRSAPGSSCRRLRRASGA